MKLTRLIASLLLILCIGTFAGGCNRDKPETEKPTFPHTDSVAVVFTTYVDSQISSQPPWHEMFTRTAINDTTITFTYTDNGDMTRQITCFIKSIQFMNAHDPLRANQDLKLTDQIHLATAERAYHFAKYEFVDPPIDGDGCFIIEATDGVVAMISYSWPRYQILTSKGTNNILPYAKMLHDGILSYMMKHSNTDIK